MAEFVPAGGDLLKADVDALVNTVNTVGVMGRGIALQFKKAFPANFKAYEKACKKDEVALGTMFVFDNGQLTVPRWIVNFPTKGHWRSKSRMADIEQGLDDLARVIEDRGITSIALPPLGCGNGGLDWTEVEPLIRSKLDALPVTVHLFAPEGPPAAAAMTVATEKPSLTEGKAALIALLDRYSQLALGATVIEVQKLMYFLQEAGQELRLNFDKGRYGPYADNLRHVLIRLEGHHLQGYGDGSKPVQEAEPIRLLGNAADEARTAIQGLDDRSVVDRIEQTLDLVEGFESAYGLELLATVHWCATQNADVDSAADAAECVRTWNYRKGRMFTDEHIEVAWDHLRGYGWISEREPVHS
jgi:O-acetyl-ADP-ribose deacetylase (regulator of RNase III)